MIVPHEHLIWKKDNYRLLWFSIACGPEPIVKPRLSKITLSGEFSHLRFHLQNEGWVQSYGEQ